MHAYIRYIYVVHTTLFFACLYESSFPGWIFECCSFEHLALLLMSCCLSTSLLLHPLLILLDVLLHPLFFSCCCCFLPILLLRSPLSLLGCWSAALSSSLPLAAPDLVGEALPPRSQRGGMTGGTRGRGQGGTRGGRGGGFGPRHGALGCGQSMAGRCRCYGCRGLCA